MIRALLGSRSAIGATGVAWILVAILQRFSRGFDPIWHIWDPRYEEKLHALPLWRRLEGNPAMIGIPLSLVVSTLLLCHWCPFWSTRIPRKRTSIVIAMIATLAVARSYPFLGADVMLYEYYAKIEVVDGLNPYSLGLLHEERAAPFPKASFWEGQATPYGPLVQRLAVNLYSPRRNHRGNAQVLRATWILVYAAFALWILGGVQARSPGEETGLYWFLLTSPVVFLELVLGAHTEMLLIPIISISLLAAERGGAMVSIFLLLASLSIKPIGALFIPPVVAHLIWVRRRRALLPLVYGVLAGLALLAILYRPYWFGWQTLAPLMRESLFHTKSLGTLVDLTWHVDPRWVQLPGVVITLVSIIWAAWVARTISDLARGLTVVLLAYLLLVVPFFQMWYLTWFIPLVIIHPALLQDKPWTIGATIFSVTAFWGSYGLQFVTAGQDRPLRMMSLLCLGPTLVFILVLLARTARRTAAPPGEQAK